MESHVGINSKSIALCPYSTGHGVTFTFDSIYDCRISLYFCATEVVNPAAKTSIKYSSPSHKAFLFILSIRLPRSLLSIRGRSRCFLATYTSSTCIPISNTSRGL